MQRMTPLVVRVVGSAFARPARRLRYGSHRDQNAELFVPNGQGPYAGRLGYSLGIDLPVRHPQSEMMSRTFDSQALLGGQNMSSSGGIAVDGMALRITLAPTSGEAGLLAGEYGEVIQIAITPI